MFENMLIEEKIKTKRGRATVMSFLLQAVGITVIVIIPLLFTQALPMHMLQTTLVAPPPPPPPPPPAGAQATPRHTQPQTQVKSELEVPVKIPQKVAMVREELPQSDAMQSAPSTGVVGGVPGGVQGGTIGGVVGGVLNSVGTNMPKLEQPKRVKVSSGVTQGLLQHKVTPTYPQLAKSARVQGSVVLQAVIGKDGTVQNLRVVSGHPMLSQAAIEAVKQWKYKPYMLNGQPTEIDTTIQVNFTLAG
jgi:protein TonB